MKKGTIIGMIIGGLVATTVGAVAMFKKSDNESEVENYEDDNVEEESEEVEDEE